MARECHRVQLHRMPAVRRAVGVWVRRRTHPRLRSTQCYVRGNSLGFHFCPARGCVVYWRALQAGRDGRRRMAVNLRLAEPRVVAQIPVQRVDWLEETGALAPDGRCVGDYWV